MTGSITAALHDLENMDAQAAQLLWDRYFERLCAFSEGRIYRRHRRLVAPEEIASDAFLALVHGVQQKKFEKVRNRDELWQMLTLIASRLIIQAHKHHGREKRGGRFKRMSGSNSSSSTGHSLVDFLQDDITPDSIVELEELSQGLLELLPSDQLRQIALWRMAGYSTAEIATELNCTGRTVERKLAMIRTIWNSFQQ